MFENRHLASFIAIFVIGVIFGILMFDFDTFYFRAFFTVAIAFAILFVVVASRSGERKKLKPFIAVALAVAAFSFGVIRVSVYNNSITNNDFYNGKSDNARYEVAEVGTSWVDARIISSEIGVSKGSVVRVYLDNLPDGLISGDEFKANVKYENASSKSQFANGVDLVGYGEFMEQYDVSGLFYNIRKSVNDNCKAMFGGFDDAESISKAVIIGDRTGLDSYIYSLYRNVGISHVLAISGLHISIIAFGILKLLTRLSVHKMIGRSISILFVICYVGLVGFSYSSVRSAIMIIALLLGQQIFIPTDKFTILFVALAGLLMTNPYSVLSTGLQLSFLCTFGIILSAPFTNWLKEWKFLNIRKIKGIKKYWVKIVWAVLPSVIVTFSAIVFSFPVLCFGFDTISYISPLMNFLTVYIFSLAILLTFAAFLIAPISIKIASIIAYPAGFVFDFVTDIARWFYDKDIGITSVHQVYMVIPFVLSIVMILSLVFLVRNKIKVFITSMVLFCISIFVCVIISNNIVSEKIIAEYNSASSEYIYFQDKGESIYLDIGGYVSNSESVYNNGKTSLDQYIILEYDGYTYSRFKRMSDNLKVYKVNLPNPTNSYEFSILSQIKELANSRNCDIITYTDVFSSKISDNASISVFYPNEVSKDERLIILDVNDKRLRFVSDKYDYLVNADIAILMDGFEGDYHNIISDTVIASEEYAEKQASKDKFISYSKKIRLEFIDEESAFLIYES